MLDEDLKRFFIAILVFIITSIIAYLFKMRQLYGVPSKLYRHSTISSNGSICEITFFNKGNQVEEDIVADLDPDLKYELLAASSSGVKFENSSLKIERMHKGTDTSVVLLVEGGHLEHSRVLSLSSKHTKGTVLKNSDSVPFNYAIGFIFAVLLVSFYPALDFAYNGYKKINSYMLEKDLSQIIEKGWSNLNEYHESTIIESYPGAEFPIRFIEHTELNGELSIKFEIYNKTSLPLEFLASNKAWQNNEASHTEMFDLVRFYSSKEIPPLSKGFLDLSYRLRDGETPLDTLDFTIVSDGEERVYGLVFSLPKPARPKQ